jgi:hypothetical protein
MSTYANEIAPGSQYSQRERIHPAWVLLAAVAAAQLFAFWLLCSHQMRKAEARRNETVVQQMALSDCLQYIPGSTIASCNARGDAQQASARSDGSSLTATVPVSFSFR